MKYTYAELINNLTRLRDEQYQGAESQSGEFGALLVKQNAATINTIINWVENCDFGSNKNADLKVLRAALDLWGKDKQVYIAVEELAELQKELLKNINRGENNRDHILEELADVLVVIECLKMIYQFNDREISEVMRFKVDRLAGRIEKSKAAKTEAKRG